MFAKWTCITDFSNCLYKAQTTNYTGKIKAIPPIHPCYPAAAVLQHHPSTLLSSTCDVTRDGEKLPENVSNKYIKFVRGVYRRYCVDFPSVIRCLCLVQTAVIQVHFTNTVFTASKNVAWKLLSCPKTSPWGRESIRQVLFQPEGCRLCKLGGCVEDLQSQIP